MIEFDKYKVLSASAEKVFGRLDDETRRIFWNAVKNYPEDLIASALDKVVQTHGFYKFPTVAEVLDAIGDSHPMVETKPNPSWCKECSGVGRTVVEYWIGDQTYNKEHFCSCEEGQSQRRARIAYYESRGRGLTTRRKEPTFNLGGE